MVLSYLKEKPLIYDLNFGFRVLKALMKEILSLWGYSKIDSWTFFLTVKKSINVGLLLRNLSELVKFGFSKPDLIEIWQLLVKKGNR